MQVFPGKIAVFRKSVGNPPQQPRKFIEKKRKKAHFPLSFFPAIHKNSIARGKNRSYNILITGETTHYGEEKDQVLVHQRTA
jgi:hypothetical protein